MIMEKIGKLYEQADRLRAYADEVKMSRRCRAKAERLPGEVERNARRPKN